MGSWWVLGGFWWVLVGSGGFWYVLVCSGVVCFGGFLVGSWWVLGVGSDIGDGFGDLGGDFGIDTKISGCHYCHSSDNGDVGDAGDASDNGGDGGIKQDGGQSSGGIALHSDCASFKLTGSKSIFFFLLTV